MEESFRDQYQKLVLIVIPIIILMWVPFCHNEQSYFPEELHSYWTREMFNEYALVMPFQLYPNISGRYWLELEDMTSFDCPRVYWPTCGWDNVTYVNACILHGINKTTIRRFGPCLNYRRKGEEGIAVPKKWKTKNRTEAETIRKSFSLSERDFHTLFSVTNEAT